METKVCNKCSKEFPATSTYWRRSSRRKDGLVSICKECQKITDSYYRKKNAKSIKTQKEIYQAKPEVKATRAKQARERRNPWSDYIDFELRVCRQFKLSVEDYINIQDKQKGCCDICGNSLYNSESKRNAHIDHNHTTGKVRALLCSHCNHTIGYCLEDIERLKAAIKYLERHNG